MFFEEIFHKQEDDLDRKMLRSPQADRQAWYGVIFNGGRYRIVTACCLLNCAGRRKIFVVFLIIDGNVSSS